MNNKFSKGRNCFNYPVISPLGIFSDKYNNLNDQIKYDVNTLLFKDKIDYFNQITLSAVQGISHLKQGLMINEVEEFVETSLHFHQKVDGFVLSELKDRCYRVSSQIIKGIEKLNLTFNSDAKILDVGAGSGLITKLVKDNLGFSGAFLTDVVDYRYEEVINDKAIKHSLFQYPFEKIKTNEMYDLLIITNTLHHCDDPFKVFRTALRYLKPDAIIVIVESCVGIEPEMLKEPIEGFTTDMPFQNVYNGDNTLNDFTKNYLKFTSEEMMLYGTFFDWLYNRVFLNENVNVPYNFGSPIAWNESFTNLFGLKEIYTFMLGFDQPTALEFHTLHILQK